MRVEHVIWRGLKSVYGVLFMKLEGKRQFGRHKRRWEVKLNFNLIRNAMSILIGYNWPST